jgi:hypothetical protein
VAIVRTDVSEEHIASIITVTRIGGLGTTLAVISNRRVRAIEVPYPLLALVELRISI